MIFIDHQLNLVMPKCPRAIQVEYFSHMFNFKIYMHFNFTYLQGHFTYSRKHLRFPVAMNIVYLEKKSEERRANMHSIITSFEYS